MEICQRRTIYFVFLILSLHDSIIFCNANEDCSAASPRYTSVALSERQECVSTEQGIPNYNRVVSPITSTPTCAPQQVVTACSGSVNEGVNSCSRCCPSPLMQQPIFPAFNNFKQFGASSNCQQCQKIVSAENCNLCNVEAINEGRTRSSPPVRLFLNTFQSFNNQESEVGLDNVGGPNYQNAHKLTIAEVTTENPSTCQETDVAQLDVSCSNAEPCGICQQRLNPIAGRYPTMALGNTACNCPGQNYQETVVAQPVVTCSNVNEPCGNCQQGLNPLAGRYPALTVGNTASNCPGQNYKEAAVAQPVVSCSNAAEPCGNCQQGVNPIAGRYPALTVGNTACNCPGQNYQEAVAAQLIVSCSNANEPCRNCQQGLNPQAGRYPTLAVGNSACNYPGQVLQLQSLETLNRNPQCGCSPVGYSPVNQQCTCGTVDCGSCGSRQTEINLVSPESCLESSGSCLQSPCSKAPCAEAVIIADESGCSSCSELTREEKQPVQIIVNVPEVKVPTPTIVLVPEVSTAQAPRIPSFGYPSAPIIVEGSKKSSLRNLLPLLLVALLDDDGFCNSNRGCNGYRGGCGRNCCRCQNNPVPYPLSTPIQSPIVRMRVE